MKGRKLGLVGISGLGLGCMGMSWRYGPADQSQALTVLCRYFELGGNFLDTAEIYGPYKMRNLSPASFARFRKCAEHLGVTKTEPLQPLSEKASNESTLGYSLRQGRRDKTRPRHLVVLPDEWVFHVSPRNSG